MSIIPPNTPNLNPANMHGGAFTTSTVGAVANGGNTQYGSFYLGQPLNLNYLGRTEGMPGGSGSPPVNRF